MTNAVAIHSRGARLREIRLRRGLSTRRVAELSRSIASDQGSEEFLISHARLAQIENDSSVPSIRKLFTLSAVYCVSISDLLTVYVDLPGLHRLQHRVNASETRVSPAENSGHAAAISVPIRLNTMSRPEETDLLSRMVKAWADFPVALLERMNPKKYRYGWIGLTDHTMDPLIRPGSFVQIDETNKLLHGADYRTEYDRPIYFLETRSGYVCSWCELIRGGIVSVPHPLSRSRVRHFALPSEAEVIGRVTAITVRLVSADGAATVRENGG
jgi:transcriptional regulator with XRE-family HTH domain